MEETLARLLADVRSAVGLDNIGLLTEDEFAMLVLEAVVRYTSTPEVTEFTVRQDILDRKVA